ncbi:hypothetical protein [Nocardia terpenica]|uniref:Uncharacterized protein n=1 Tax=Nocardia terpenica TaxID=455432 RepID=A0A164NPZ6_9NOCA|nr:hypothetical protein [Nocardia terpenica]KZM74593.1 hypothetical protein AWN90_21155 [Nocardia terpenica]NQE93821.1 hypothetical protein [Nocardia terpenica]
MNKSLTLVEWAVPTILAGWFIASVLGQHPDRTYDKIRRVDKSSGGMFIPNWRFFAPEPGTDDTHFLYRLANEDKSEHTEWREVFSFAPRKLTHAFWFPGRRIEKAIFDVSSTLMHNPETALEKEAKRSACQLVNEFVRRRLTPHPDYPLFQVLMVRYSGYDHGEDPKYDMIFDYEKVGEP